MVSISDFSDDDIDFVWRRIKEVATERGIFDEIGRELNDLD